MIIQELKKTYLLNNNKLILIPKWRNLILTFKTYYSMEKTIKIILGILLLLCLLPMPYGFFELVRFVAFVGFGYLAFMANKRNSQNEMILFGALALLFQPFFKIALGRTLWNIVDVVVGIGLLITSMKNRIGKK